MHQPLQSLWPCRINSSHAIQGTGPQPAGGIRCPDEHPQRQQCSQAAQPEPTGDERGAGASARRATMSLNMVRLRQLMSCQTMIAFGAQSSRPLTSLLAASRDGTLGEDESDALKHVSRVCGWLSFHTSRTYWQRTHIVNICL